METVITDCDNKKIHWFQKNLIVWKQGWREIWIRCDDKTQVSEELNSVETVIIQFYDEEYNNVSEELNSVETGVG